MTVFESWEVPPDILEKINPIIEKDIPESLKYIHSSTDKMDALLAGLLKISRIGRLELHKTQLDMNLLMGEIVEIFEFRLKEAGVKLEISKLHPCIGDEHQLNQVFSNLLTNAAESIQRKGLKQGEVNIRAEVDRKDNKDMVHIQISDNGEGIEADTIEHIFEQGFSTKKESTSGIGLHWCANIVTAMQGRIYAESEGIGKGANFHLMIPGDPLTH